MAHVDKRALNESNSFAFLSLIACGPKVIRKSFPSAVIAPVAGIEPALIRLTGGCLTVWPHRNSGRWIRTIDLQVMSLASCHCSIPQSAQRELNSRLLHGKQMGYHYTMGAN